MNTGLLPSRDSQRNDWYSFYGYKLGAPIKKTGEAAVKALDGYTGEVDLFKTELKFNPRETINYILYGLELVSITGTIERRGMLRCYSSDQLIEIYNTASDDRLDPSNRLFEDIIAVLAERNRKTRKILISNGVPTTNAYKYNPLSGNSELIDQGTQRYHIN